jgi:succinate dehydrogenase / fumarate reductase, cytochrome b subunit
VIEERVLRKWFELSAVVPLAVYVVVHLGSYMRVLFGATTFGASGATHFQLVAEIALVWLPLAFHAIYGAWLIPRKIEGVAPERNQTVLLRVSGVGALGFLLYHASWLRLPLLRGERSPADVGNMLAAGLSATDWGIPVPAILHLLGLAVVSAHLATGLARFFEKWRLASAARAQLVARALSLALFGVGSATVVELATGSALPNFVR